MQFSQITRVWVYHFKLFSLVKSTEDEKVLFIKGNKLKLTQVELLSFIFGGEEVKKIFLISMNTIDEYISIDSVNKIFYILVDENEYYFW